MNAEHMLYIARFIYYREYMSKLNEITDLEHK